MLTHLFIDFDNTMMATEQYAVPSLIARFNSLYAAQLASPLTERTFKENFHGQARDVLCDNLSRYFSIRVDCAELYKDREWEMMQALQNVSGGITMADNIISTLLQLKTTHKIYACLVSNNPIQRALTAMRFSSTHDGEDLAKLLGTRYFEAGDRQKPLPDVYLRAMAQTGASTRTSCAIEDSITGATSALAAGLKVIGFTGFYSDRRTATKNLLDAGCIDVIADWAELQQHLIKHSLIT